MKNNRYGAQEAVKLLEKSHIEGRRVLGVDGFEASSLGQIARLDLVLDVSGDDWSNDRAYEEAINFVTLSNDENITFEIVFD